MPCKEAPGLLIEKRRLEQLGGTFLGIIGDSNHSFGYHLCYPPAGDYSLAGAVNKPVGEYACAIDCGMNFPNSRQWLAWLITEIREDRITGIAEVIGSLDGKNARYWSDESGWQQNGVTYEDAGHVTWTHVAIYRSTAKQDHRILTGWNGNGNTEGGSFVPDDYGLYGKPASVEDRTSAVLIADIWSQIIRETSPYVDNAPAPPIARIRKTETGVSELLERETVVELSDDDIAAIADAVSMRISQQLADQVLDLMSERLRE